MNHFIKTMLERAKKFNIWDYWVMKLCLFAFGLRFATVIPAMITINPWIYGIIWFVCVLYLFVRIFKK